MCNAIRKLQWNRGGLWWQLSIWMFMLADSLAVMTATDYLNHPNWPMLNHERCGVSSSDRIIGGTNAPLGAYPWITRIGYRRGDLTTGPVEYRCAGSLITEFHVITAAHCIINLAQGLKVVSVRLGEHNTLTNPDCEGYYCAEPVQDINVVRVTVHQDYDVRLFRNDLAILQLEQPARFTSFVLPICIPSGPLLERNYTGQSAETAGWGIYDMGILQASVILQRIWLPIVNIENCIAAFGRIAHVGNDQYCVGGEPGKDSCSGDSGGPLMKVDVSPNGSVRYFLIGVVSYGMKICGTSGYPAVYTKISNQLPWILDNIQVGWD